MNGNIQLLEIIFTEFGYDTEIRSRSSEILPLMAEDCSYSSLNPGMPDGWAWLLDQKLITFHAFLAIFRDHGPETRNINDLVRAMRVQTLILTEP